MIIVVDYGPSHLRSTTAGPGKEENLSYQVSPTTSSATFVSECGRWTRWVFVDVLKCRICQI
jgi:hypothetical protein